MYSSRCLLNVTVRTTEWCTLSILLIVGVRTYSVLLTLSVDYRDENLWGALCLLNITVRGPLLTNLTMSVECRCEENIMAHSSPCLMIIGVRTCGAPCLLNIRWEVHSSPCLLIICVRTYGAPCLLNITVRGALLTTPPMPVECRCEENVMVHSSPCLMLMILVWVEHLIMIGPRRNSVKHFELMLIKYLKTKMLLLLFESQHL